MLRYRKGVLIRGLLQTAVNEATISEGPSEIIGYLDGVILTPFYTKFVCSFSLQNTCCCSTSGTQHNTQNTCHKAHFDKPKAPLSPPRH